MCSTETGRNAARLYVALQEYPVTKTTLFDHGFVYNLIAFCRKREVSLLN